MAYQPNQSEQLMLYTASQDNQQDNQGNLGLIQGIHGHPRLSWVDVRGQELARFVHNNIQVTVLGLPGRPVIYMTGRCKVTQITSMRDSYVNAWLIQSRGIRVDPCSRCLTAMNRDPDGFARPFPICVRLPGHFGGCCGNCKWPDAAARCSQRDELQTPQALSYGGQRPGSSGRALPYSGEPGSSPSNAIKLDLSSSEEDTDNGFGRQLIILN